MIRQRLKRVDRTGALLAIAIYVLAATFGWAMVGALLALWWGRA
jgi:hypothetical protein